ncbi:uncharacterized protein LOC105701497 [Orussus abietinus]|uniref:uncharacterized protein LOC105701497 n=1 Tax=Orussus abietinus TaxID=222816 RepID=UPI000626D27B|nr:uncharacterized protein LOC105701497 [Orussus abietinus]
MRLLGRIVLLCLVGTITCEKEEEGDTSSAFLEAAQVLFSNKDAVGGLQGVANAFMQSDAGKQVNDMLTGGKANGDGIGDIISGLGSLVTGANSGSTLGSIFESLTESGNNKRAKRDHGDESSGGIDFDTMINLASMFMGQKNAAQGLMGLMPMILQNMGGDFESSSNDKHDHSGHSWFMPPVLESIHVMWDHFSNSELGQTLWKNSGLANIVGMMSDEHGRIQYEKIMESFENPTLRRRWIKSLTNFVAEWISHISDPATQQRYLTTVQYVGNSFLKSQGYPKPVMFDSTRPADSLSRLINAVAKRHLNMKIDSYKYIKPAVAYFQELINLASEKGFIMSRVNAMELSNKLSETINNDLIAPLLKVYRGYKWATKSPQCASHILCVINSQSTEGDNKSMSSLRSGLTKLASFPAAWAISNKTGQNFWTLYGAVQDNQKCFEMYPADCTAFHEEEIRVTTEYAHNEL